MPDGKSWKGASGGQTERFFILSHAFVTNELQITPDIMNREHSKTAKMAFKSMCEARHASFVENGNFKPPTNQPHSLSGEPVEADPLPSLQGQRNGSE